MEVLDGSEAQCSPEIADDLMLLGRECGHNGLITSFASQKEVPGRQENAHDLLQELNKDIRGATFEAVLRSVRGSLTDIRSHISRIREVLDGDLRQIQSELEKMVEKVRQPSKKHQSDQQVFIETPSLVPVSAMVSCSKTSAQKQVPSGQADQRRLPPGGDEFVARTGPRIRSSCAGQPQTSS
jgi:hypothetical protein